ncbi:MAG: ATP-grasp domain-containing protein [Planctomycetes bacterium]|nr:ATP-grasp domain-containing protein [Planctomycetota bacterium]
MAIDVGTKIAVVGASARAAVFSLLRAKRQVAAADLFADADLARHCPAMRISPYPEGFFDWLAETECVNWLYTGALENSPALVDRLSRSQFLLGRTLLGHAGDVLRRVRDPLELQAVLTRADLQFPETIAAAGKQINNAWLGKTYSGSSGSGVGVIDGATYLQRRVEGLPLSAVFRGSQLLGVTRQLVGEMWAGASEYQYCGSIAPWALSWECERQVQRLGEVLREEFGLTELYGVDLMQDGDQLWTLEVNPRYTASVEIVERAYGISVFGSIEEQRPSHCVGKAVLFAKAPLVISAEINLSLMQQAGGIAWPEIADIPVTGTAIAVGQPVLTLFAEAESCEAVAMRLRERVVEIERLLRD